MHRNCKLYQFIESTYFPWHFMSYIWFSFDIDYINHYVFQWACAGLFRKRTNASDYETTDIAENDLRH